VNKSSLKFNLKPLDFEGTSNTNNGKQHSDSTDINPVP
jgi:hypothetical protein